MHKNCKVKLLQANIMPIYKVELLDANLLGKYARACISPELFPDHTYAADMATNTSITLLDSLRHGVALNIGTIRSVFPKNNSFLSLHKFLLNFLAYCCIELNFNQLRKKLNFSPSLIDKRITKLSSRSAKFSLSMLMLTFPN